MADIGLVEWDWKDYDGQTGAIAAAYMQETATAREIVEMEERGAW